MNMKKLMAGAVASVVAVTGLATFASAEKVDEGKFIIIFADSDWKAQIWGRGDDESIDSSYETTQALNGNGTYTVTLDLSKGYTANGWVDEGTGDPLEITTGNGIAVLGVQIYGDYPTLGVDIQSVKFDGTEAALNGASYTNDEDSGRRTNIYNEWAGYDASKEDNLTKDADNATATLIDNSSIGEWTKIEITFEVYGLEDDAASSDDNAASGDDNATTDDGAASGDDNATTDDGAASGSNDAPAAGTGNTNAATNSNKGNADTGVEGVAVVAGLAVVAAGAVVIAKKRK